MRTSHLTRALLVITIFYLAGCNKSDISKKDSLTLSGSDNVSVDLSGCKLRRIWAPYGPGSVTGVFTYNSKGNPTKLVFNNNGTGNPDHYFFYDNQNRLIEWHQTYDNGNVVSLLHRFVYSGAGVAPVRDTVMALEGDTVTFVHTFTYDAQGRIVKENIKNIYNAGAPLDPQRNPTYTYDNRGNLAVAGWKSSWYDNKVNPLRGSPVFQLIFKNWSQNNAAVQPKYNSKGLPLSLNPNNDVFFNSTTASVLVYDCQ